GSSAASMGRGRLCGGGPPRRRAPGRAASSVPTTVGALTRRLRQRCCRTRRRPETSASACFVSVDKDARDRHRLNDLTSTTWRLKSDRGYAVSMRRSGAEDDGSTTLREGALLKGLRGHPKQMSRSTLLRYT